MKQVMVFVVLVTLVVASPAFAAGNESSAAPAPSTVTTHDFSARAAGLDRLARETEGKKDDARAPAARAGAPAPAQAAGGKSIWKTPWPYVIAAAVVVAVVAVGQNSEGGIY